MKEKNKIYFKKNSTANNNISDGEAIRPSSSGMTAAFGKNQGK